MSVELFRASPGKFDSRTLSRETLSRWTGRTIISNTNIEFQKRKTLTSTPLARYVLDNQGFVAEIIVGENPVTTSYNIEQCIFVSEIIAGEIRA